MKTRKEKRKEKRKVVVTFWLWIAGDDGYDDGMVVVNKSLL